MKKLEIIIRPERLDDLKNILNSNGAHGLMITNIMGYGSQKGHKQVYNGVDFGGNLLPKVKVESIVSDETYENMATERFSYMRFLMQSVSVPANVVTMHYNFISMKASMEMALIVF